ncbi:hypothetical protein NPIL_446811 [Nephila pilipes]|uniref:Uncharacterized protein n=1 Tax=Nephila pilipes TaxID=299642 RepID=A0A8X6Q8U2_NEPPI|nr:hypothetical protein NPIL_446811 [Nephila pilipes]
MFNSKKAVLLPDTKQSVSILRGAFKVPTFWEEDSGLRVLCPITLAYNVPRSRFLVPSTMALVPFSSSCAIGHDILSVTDSIMSFHRPFEASFYVSRRNLHGDRFSIVLSPDAIATCGRCFRSVD